MSVSLKMSSSSSNAKPSGLKTSNNTKTIMKDTNIYPGFNHNKIQNELSSLTFVKAFPDIQRWITSRNLELFIKDPHGDKIPFISTSDKSCRSSLTISDPTGKMRFTLFIPDSTSEFHQKLLHSSQPETSKTSRGHTIDYLPLKAIHWKKSNLVIPELNL
jgi:hypothetical protein